MFYYYYKSKCCVELKGCHQYICIAAEKTLAVQQQELFHVLPLISCVRAIGTSRLQPIKQYLYDFKVVIRAAVRLGHYLVHFQVALGAS
jgi:hypothetical protein